MKGGLLSKKEKKKEVQHMVKEGGLLQICFGKMHLYYASQIVQKALSYVEG